MDRPCHAAVVGDGGHTFTSLCDALDFDLWVVRMWAMTQPLENQRNRHNGRLENPYEENKSHSRIIPVRPSVIGANLDSFETPIPSKSGGPFLGSVSITDS